MNQEIKDEWVKRLREWDIPQGTEYLGRPDGKRCCLGVFCDIAVERGVIPPPVASYPRTYDGVLEYGNDDGYGRNRSVLPSNVVEWADFRDQTGTLDVEVQHQSFTSLSELNDEGMDFNKIADLIEYFF